MGTNNIWKRFRNKSILLQNNWISRRPFKMPGKMPYISFTFDDFPKSAHVIGGKILERYGVTGTYYVSMGLLNQTFSSGEIADIDTLKNVLSDGHELGCHTYSHIDPWDTRPEYFESSIIKNRKSISCILPGFEFKTFSYPYGNVTPKAKSIASKYYNCCRGGIQSINKNIIDLNYLKAYFIDKHKQERVSKIKELISYNCKNKGWLIFVTHGVDNEENSYGCTPDYFEEIVRYSANSGAVVLPVLKTFYSLLSLYK